MDIYTMTPSESVEAFRRVVCMSEGGHVVVATGDLPERLDLWINRGFLKAGKSSIDGAPSSSSYPRPNLQSIYVAPRDENEQTIVSVWQKVLGIEQLGIHDNFFDLGGHSLLATRLVAQLREAFHVDLPLRKIFEAPTVAGLAKVITDLQERQEDQDKGEILEMLAHLSEEEAETEINRRRT